MAKRFTATEIWAEDWFLDMPLEYKLFWYYMLGNCNHAGIFKVNVRSFCGLNGVKIESKQAILLFNSGKERVRDMDGVWYIEDFFVYQYGTTFNPNNRVHDSIQKELKKYNIDVSSIRGLIDLKDRVKDKEKDKEDKKKVVLRTDDWENQAMKIVSPSSHPNWREECGKFWKNESFKVDFCKTHKIPLGNLEKLMGDFILDQNLKGGYKDAAGLKIHFIRSYNKYHKGQSYGPNKSTQTFTQLPSEEDYENMEVWPDKS